MKNPVILMVILIWACEGMSFGQSTKDSTNNEYKSDAVTNLDKIYWDQSHCLAMPEIRSDRDASITCYCRDAIEEARYIYFTYLLPGKDRNLNGPFLALQANVSQECGWNDGAVTLGVTEGRNWNWKGPEVVRTYPPDEVIERISPETKDGRPTGMRWVPYTVQLIYRDGQGRVTKTENYATRELDPVTSK
jgi:hypothetical protein